VTASCPVIAIVGPTGVGKSAVAEELAVRRRSIVLNADSMQVYRGMDIGTAKVPAASRRVEHFGIDLVDPGQAWSAARYQDYARGVIDRALAAGTGAIVCGGTGLYLRAALDVMDFPAGEQTDNPIRARWEQFLEEYGPDALFDRLRAADVRAAALLHPNNTRRVIRALEMHEQGVSYADQAAGFKQPQPYYDATWFGLTMPREQLYAAIDARVDGMVAAGLPAEVERLLDGGYAKALTAAAAIGYKELVPVIRDGASPADAIDAIKQATRRYAKRQLTWFRADSRVQWIDVAGKTAAQIADVIGGLL
jgi:tRNA dimethylallyltransferase